MIQMINQPNLILAYQLSIKKQNQNLLKKIFNTSVADPASETIAAAQGDRANKVFARKKLDEPSTGHLKSIKNFSIH